MRAAQIRVHFEGRFAAIANDQYQIALETSGPAARIPPGYTLLDWCPSESEDSTDSENSTDLVVVNHGGPIDPARIAKFVRENICPAEGVTAREFGSMEIPG